MYILCVCVTQYSLVSACTSTDAYIVPSPMCVIQVVSQRTTQLTSMYENHATLSSSSSADESRGQLWQS
jgi:hypothetical protein